jgi:midasin (ATPase involved in ribosome maturation)
MSTENTMEEHTALQLKWSLISDSVSVLSSILAENLRMILEPTVASRLQCVTSGLLYALNLLSFLLIN